MLGVGVNGGTAIAHADYVSVIQAMPQPVAQSAYLEQVRRIAPRDPPGLKDRDAELAELAWFCLDPNGPSYAWWQAGPWAGKSALLSSFVVRPPADFSGRVRIVSFLITARLAAQDTREAFTVVLAEQLAALLRESLPTVLPEVTREAYLLGLLSRAAAACQRAGGRLVLVVDGLDEDRGVTTGPDAHSIAGLLPADPPAGMRVIVAGRPNPPVPDDVPDWHPLRDPAIIRPLEPSPHARDVQRLARQELLRLLRGSATEQDVLGLLTAARGGLSARDLADLAQAPLWQAEEILHTAAGRTLQARPSLLQPGTRPDVYLLGHEELQAAATSYLGGRLAGYLNRLHAWADSYRTLRWPADTPEYLLAGYFHRLEDLGDLPRMTELGLDMARHDKMLDLTGGDSAALAEARAGLDRIAAQDDPDLASALALACHRDRLADRNANVPVSLPAVWATLGQLPRAEALARSITSPASQASALAQVAQAAAAAGHHREAQAVAALAEATARTIRDPHLQAIALAQVAQALAAATRHQAEQPHSTLSVPDRQARALTEAAQALASHPGRPAGRPTQTHSYPGRQVRALAEVAQALAAVGLHQEAEATARWITSRLWQADALAQVAQVQAAAGHHQQAEATAAQAVTAAAQDNDPDYLLPGADLRVSIMGKVAQALAAAGRYQHAQAVAMQAETTARAIGDPHSQASALAEAARALAAVGRRQEAEVLAAQAETTARTITSRSWQASALTKVLRALAAAGHYQRAEAVARAITDPEWQASALTNVAQALATAGHHQQAQAVVMEAEAAARTITAPDWRVFRTLAKVTQALADAGLDQQAQAVAAQAEATARAITDPLAQENALTWVVEALAAADQYGRAEATARTITFSYSRVRALAAVIQALARAGHYQQAEATARTITDPYLQASALTEVAQALAAAGHHQQAKVAAAQAEAAARTVTHQESQVRALAGVTRAMAAAGHHRHAQDTAAQAEATARTITDPYLQASALTEVAQALAAAGHHQQALAVALTITDPFWHTSALTQIARALAAAGHYQHAQDTAAQAEATVRAIIDLDQEANALAQVAQALAAAGRYQHAQAVALTITDPGWQANALAQIAGALARAGEVSRASRTAAAACAAGDWTHAVGPVLLLVPSAYTTLARTLEEYQ